jgi:pantothenate kinase
MILAQIEKGKLAVSQQKAIDAILKKHNAEIAAQEAKRAEQSRIDAEKEKVISAIHVKDGKEIAALRASGATWEIKFDTIAGDYNVLLDKSEKQNGLIEGLKLEIGGIQEEVFTLKAQAVESQKLFDAQKLAWQKSLANTIRKAGRSFGVVVGPVAMIGFDGKINYGAGICVGFRLY